MYLSKIYIKNFRGIKELLVDMGHRTKRISLDSSYLR